MEIYRCLSACLSKAGYVVRALPIIEQGVAVAEKNSFSAFKSELHALASLLRIQSGLEGNQDIAGISHSNNQVR